ncbi:alpha/beta fold hydrolase [Candidatus Bipolaricaulota bacterium]|nr:alpha/beta fold hydrolase [Candidatus Bipolaricaulota bacterium]MBS3792608.1 alpha/beta fold hydrolase [Candidatus Bipolaricaulota bacterium]MBS3813593.1 alpha/beta fold hydrolase [Candidatus Bipolaricaulota bacterium]
MAKVKVNGIDLYYEFKGNPEGKVVVFVNGLLTDTNSWAQHVPYFEDEYQILLFDSRGQGKSDKPEGPYSVNQHANDLAELLQKLEISQANFVGLSNGGTALLPLALNHPKLVHSIVLADAYSYVDAILEAKIDAWLEAARVSPELRFLVATPYVWGNTFLEENQELFDQFREAAHEAPQEATENLIEGAKLLELPDSIKKITAPGLIVVGEKDILTPPEYSRYIASRLPNGKLTILEDAGHASAIERAEKFCHRVLDFFEEVI